MAVVINDFEVIAQPPAPAPRPDATSAPPAPAPSDIEKIVQREMERAARVWAH